MNSRRRDDQPGLKEIGGILHMVDKGRAKPTTALIKSIHEIAIDGLKAISEPDERVRTVSTVILVLQLSTALVPRKMADGSTAYRGRITNPEGFDYACDLIHNKLR